TQPLLRCKLQNPNAYVRTGKFFIQLVGTRGVVLLVIGTIWLFLGTGLLVKPMERFSRPGSGGVLDFLDKGPGIYILSSMWIVGGVLALVAATSEEYTP